MKNNNWILVELENYIFWVFGYWVFQKKVLFHPNENGLSFDMRHCWLFLHYGWFLQNLEKDFIRTMCPS